MRCDADINNNRNHTKDAEYAKCASCFFVVVLGFAFGAAGIWVAAVVVGDNWPIRGSG